MRLRLSSIDEFQLLTCLKHGLWGAKMDRFGEWRQGDYLLLTVSKSLAPARSPVCHSRATRRFGTMVFIRFCKVLGRADFFHLYCAWQPRARLLLLGVDLDMYLTRYGVRRDGLPGLGTPNAQHAYMQSGENPANWDCFHLDIETMHSSAGTTRLRAFGA